MKERVTLTLDAGLLKRIDQKVDGHQIKNRSHAVELLLLKAMGKNKPTMAFLLAGGNDDSLSKVIGSVPKCLAPIGDKTLIEHVINLFKRYGINQLIISAGIHLETIKEFLGDGSSIGVSITYLKEETPLGTAGAIKAAKKYLNNIFYVSNVDELKDINLLDFYVFHSDHRGIGTIGLKTVSDPSRYGVANMTGNHIISFVEKPTAENAPSNLVNAGIYVLDPEIIEYIPDGYASLEKDVFPKLAKANLLFGYSFGGKWMDINSVEDYELAQREWVSQAIKR